MPDRFYIIKKHFVITKNISYRFTCENCGLQTDWLDTSVKAEGTEFIPYGAFRIVSDILSPPPPSIRLRKQVQKDFDSKMKNAKENYASRNYRKTVGVFNSDCKGRCPACKHYQTWAKTPGAGLAVSGAVMLILGVSGVVFSAVPEAAGDMIHKEIYSGSLLAGLIFSSFLLLAGISLGVYYLAVEAKLRKLSQKEALTEIDWLEDDLSQENTAVY